MKLASGKVEKNHTQCNTKVKAIEILIINT